jgi:hypothetical protein
MDDISKPKMKRKTTENLFRGKRIHTVYGFQIITDDHFLNCPALSNAGQGFKFDKREFQEIKLQERNVGSKTPFSTLVSVPSTKEHRHPT